MEYLQIILVNLTNLEWYDLYSIETKILGKLKNDIAKVEISLCINPHIRGVFCLWDDG